jgi:hypothetical protein
VLSTMKSPPRLTHSRPLDRYLHPRRCPKRWTEEPVRGELFVVDTLQGYFDQGAVPFDRRLILSHRFGDPDAPPDRNELARVRSVVVCESPLLPLRTS